MKELKMQWILILYIYAGYSPSLTNVPGFATEQECVAAGEVGKHMVGSGMTTTSKFVCVSQTK
jgi:hypothetical protein